MSRVCCCWCCKMMSSRDAGPKQMVRDAGWMGAFITSKMTTVILLAIFCWSRKSWIIFVFVWGLFSRAVWIQNPHSIGNLNPEYLGPLTWLCAVIFVCCTCPIWAGNNSQESFSGLWWVRTLESRLSIGILDGKSELQDPNLPESQKCLLGWYPKGLFQKQKKLSLI